MSTTAMLALGAPLHIWYMSVSLPEVPASTGRSRCVTSPQIRPMPNIFALTFTFTYTPARTGSILMEADGLEPCGTIGGSGEAPSYALRVAGFMLSWCSAILYLCSRIPQIRMNCERRSTKGG